ncbi:MAG: PAS-domain containing protein [Gammaproteobacteria bacterium]|uniref:PAS-domain containing protein n=1 Tax=Rhodoferax sp. TaxID=50421 RepID=UPI0017EA6097|nr:PAS-domain containing protein [Rhodoferax sp.]MBU3900234.1 PAS-domain containing protein [Gammaproteobacteria bacterium]MBA3057933.1 PAS domain S-box protein [Rhodoferax sp.]MBU3997980.1 PAS-domain containing protein [Gammaproteobacteria bacterium]MBU4079428.1 PAS-domain containing protein [Gammaproteobacteria bacterium]MBU4114389.1 PAS-domain containing protein [Gammaproteobacteria bacterium]
MPSQLSIKTSSVDRQKEFLQAGLDRIDQGLTVIDGNLQLVAWNQAFLRLLDFPEGMAYVGATFESFIRYNAERGEYGPGDVQELIAERVRLASRFVSHYTERARPDGRILAVRGDPLPDNGFVTVYTDMTASRRLEQQIQQDNAELEDRVAQRTKQLTAAQQRLTEADAAAQRITTALRCSEENLRLITDTVPALIGYFDQQEIYSYTNKGYSDWFGFTKEEMLGRSIHDVVGDEVYASVSTYVRQALQGQQVSYEYAMRRPGGQVFYARSELVPELDAEGRVIGCFVLSVNITDLKNAQSALVHAQKMEAVGQLTGGLAHDFNNLLTVVIGNLVTLHERYPNDPDICEFVVPALKASRRGAALIKRLLAFASKQPLAPRSVNIADLVADTMILLKRTLPAHISVTSIPMEEPLFAMTDAQQLENALLNLALNSRDAMPDGGQLVIQAQRMQLDLARVADFDVAPGSYVALSVSDTGAGMDAATQARASDPFFTTKRFGLGSGLGLSMVYGFAKQSGGGIRIQSALGEGCTVTLMLPYVCDKLELDALTGTPHGSGQHGAQHPLVLLVEDDPDVRRVIRLQLVELGYPVIEADHAADALDLLATVPSVGILISDMVMPGCMDGRTLCREASLSAPDVKTLLISGYAMSSENAIGPPLLKKPFTAVELQRALDGLMS